MNKVISIIIPTCNMEKYLHKCLSSLLILRNLDKVQAIIVNDGSQDTSLQIATEFVNQYPDVFCVIDKQ